MTNKVKNYYTAWMVDNSNGFGSRISVKGNSFPEGSAFSFDIWVCLEEQTNVIVSQNGGFSFGVNGNNVVVRQNGYTVTLGKTGVEIPKNRWINLWIMYDGKKISCMVNGIVLAENKDFSMVLYGDKEIVFGEEFTGYIRSFRLYEGKYEEKMFQKYFIAADYQKDEMKELKSFLDFTKSTIADKTGRSISVFPKNSCAFVDLVDIYCPLNGGCIDFNQRPDINPGGSSTGCFSVYTKMYIRPGSQERYYVWTNGKPGMEDSVSLYCKKEDGNTRFIYSHGTEDITLGGDYAAYQWVDIIISSDGENVTVFLNGSMLPFGRKHKISRKQDGLFKIGGDGSSKTLLCPDYLHSVAVFDCLLTQKDADDFMENHPFVLEDGLLALASFQSGMACELTQCEEIEAGEKGLFAAQRTLRELREEKYEYRLNYTGAAGSSMAVWEAEQVFAAYTAFGEAFTGGVATISAVARKMIIRYFSRHIALLNRLKQLYYAPTVSPREVVGALSSTAPAMAVVSVASAISSGVSIPAVTSALVAGGALDYIFGGLAIFASISAVTVTAAIATVITVINEIHQHKPDDDEDDDEEKKTTVELMSITLQHSPDDYSSSAVRCRDYKGVLSGEEWIKGKKCVHPAVYVAEKIGKLKIKVRFKLNEETGAEGGKTHKVSLTVEETNSKTGFFKKMEYEANNLATGEHEIVLEAKENSSLPIDIRFYESNLWWMWEIDGEKKNVPNTKLEIYTVPRIGMNNIYLEEGFNDYYPAIEYLAIYARLIMITLSDDQLAVTSDHINRGSVSVPQNTLEQITLGLNGANIFRYIGRANGNYVDIIDVPNNNVTVLLMHERGFLEIIYNYFLRNIQPDRVLEIECEAYAAILVYFFNLWGAFALPRCIINPNVNNQRGVIHTNIIKTAGNEAKEEVFNYHFIVLAESNEGLGYYDATLSAIRNGIPWVSTGLDFQGVPGPTCRAANEQYTYRGLVVRDNTDCVLDTRAYVLIITP